ncbi:MAG: serine hydrolase [Gemmatimonadales bacterium]|jgi:CubicO group peptidase (beta-lactamase class C family)
MPRIVRLTMAWGVAALCQLAVTTPLIAQQAPPTLIEVGTVYPDSLGPDDVQAYQVQLDSASFVTGQVEQTSVDVRVTVRDPSGDRVVSVDGPSRGPEEFQFATDATGVYRIEVAPFQHATGRYELTVDRVEPEASNPADRVDQLMSRFGEDTPGGVVAVVRDGEVAFARAYGMADLTFGIPMTTETRNNIGSTSKQFTAFAVLLLAKEGRLSLDDDVRDYIEDLPDFAETVTIRNLLTHTSGYREFLNEAAMGGRNLGEGDYIDRDEIIEFIQRQPELQNSPGAEFNYNNSGFALASMIVERVTDTPFATWMREHVFLPLGMTHTSIRTERSEIVPGGSRGYGRDDEGGYRELMDLAGAMGAGGIYTTVADMAKWMGNLQTGAYGGRDLINQMTTRNVLTNGDTTSYGLGLFIDEDHGLRRIQHGGADNAHRSTFVFYPEIETGILVETNYANTDASLAGAITEAFLSDEFEDADEADVADADGDTEADDFDAGDYEPENFDRYAGRYELDEAPGFVLTFSRRADSLFVQATGQSELRIHAVSDSTFEIGGVEASVTFHEEEDGPVKSLTLHQNGDHPAQRLVDWAPDADALAAYAGRYFSQELETYYDVIVQDGHLVVQHRRLDDVTLTPISENKFSGGYPLATVEFTVGADGVATGFAASNGRTRDVRFARVE